MVCHSLLWNNLIVSYILFGRFNAVSCCQYVSIANQRATAVKYFSALICPECRPDLLNKETRYFGGM